MREDYLPLKEETRVCSGLCRTNALLKSQVGESEYSVAADVTVFLPVQ